jgi:Bardet-Biedl syndrome 7 protein
MTSNSWRCS